MTTAFVIGNGISRRGLDLTQLQPYGKIYGCNALYREFTPDVLVATDKPIATIIQFMLELVSNMDNMSSQYLLSHALPSLSQLVTLESFMGILVFAY